MPTTLEQFKRAFAGQIADDPLKERDRQVESALKELKKAVESLDETAPSIERHKGALLDLVKRYAETKNQNGRAPKELGQELQQIDYDAVAELTQVQNSLQPASGALPMGTATQRADSDDLSDDEPQSAVEESRYHGNLKGIQAALDQALNATAPDGTSREIQIRLGTENTMMIGATIGGDFKQANYYQDELLGILREYQRAVDAYNKRAKADRDAQAAFEKRYKELKPQIDGILYGFTTFPGSAEIQEEIGREEQMIILNDMQTNFAGRLNHLDKIADAVARYNAAVAKLDKDARDKAEKDKQEAPKRAFESKLNAIKPRLDALTKRSPGPKDPFADQLKKIFALKDQLQKQMSGKTLDYAVAGKTLNELGAAIWEYDFSQAALKRQQADQAEKKARDTYPAELRWVDQMLESFDNALKNGGAPFEKGGAILDKLKAERANFANEERWHAFEFSFTSRLKWVREMKQHIADYQAASVEFWKSQYDAARGMLPAKEVKAALDPKSSSDDLLKEEQTKLKRHMKNMDRFAGSKEFYKATVAGIAASLQLRKFKLLSYQTPGPNKKDIVVKARLLGPPIQGPASHTLLMLLDNQGAPLADQSGAALNKDGTALLKSWGVVYAQESEWRKELDFIHKDGAQGDAALKQVARAGQAIAQGAGGEKLVKSIEKYKDLTLAAEKALIAMNGKWKEFEREMLKYNGALLAQSKVASERKKKTAEDQRDEEASNVQKRKDLIKTAITSIVTFVAAPEWAIVKSIAAGLAPDIVADTLVSTERLQQLQAAAELAAQELDNIVDQIQLNQIETAFKSVDVAKNACAEAKKDFERAGAAMDFVEKDVAVAMHAGGMADAGKAVEKRRAIVDAAKAAKPMLEKYSSAAATLGSQIETLRRRYLGSSMSEDMPGINGEAVTAMAQGNAESLTDFGDYLLQPIKDAKQELEYLAKPEDQTYMNKYNKIGKELVKAVLNRRP